MAYEPFYQPTVVAKRDSFVISNSMLFPSLLFIIESLIIKILLTQRCVFKLLSDLFHLQSVIFFAPCFNLGFVF